MRNWTLLEMVILGVNDKACEDFSPGFPKYMHLTTMFINERENRMLVTSEPIGFEK